MRFRIIRPTNWNPAKQEKNKHVYPLIGGSAAHKLALTESVKFPNTKIYMSHAKTMELMYIYANGKKHIYTTYFWRKNRMNKRGGE